MNAPPLRPYQLSYLDFARNKPASLCSGAMGSGKTAMALALNDEWRYSRTLVLCPTTVRNVWRGQIPKHSNRDINAVILDKGSVMRRTKQADRACRDWKRNIIVVANYEAVWRWPLREWLLSREWDLVIADESQRIMRESHTALFCCELGNRAEKKLALSGTPLTNDALSVWAQCRFLDNSIFGDDLEAFMKNYQNRYAIGCRKAWAKLNELFAVRGLAQWTPPEWAMRGTINTDEYLQKLSSIAYRVENVDLNLPALTIEKRTFKLSSSARSIYNAIENGHINEIESGRWPDVRGSFAVTMRLQQITSGFLPNAEGNITPLDSGKAQCLEDILTEACGEPVVVFVRFVEDLNTVERIAAKLGLRYGEISGRRKDGMTDIGTMPEHLQLVGLQEQAGGAGIDMTRARIGVDYSPSWREDVWEQKLARIYRPPQTRPVLLIKLMAEDSVDGEIKRALGAKNGIISQVWREMQIADLVSP